jgi:hypothetical protein
MSETLTTLERDEEDLAKVRRRIVDDRVSTKMLARAFGRHERTIQDFAKRHNLKPMRAFNEDWHDPKAFRRALAKEQAAKSDPRQLELFPQDSEIRCASRAPQRSI